VIGYTVADKKPKKTAATMASPTAAGRVAAKTTQQAGKSKSDRAVRQAQNKGVKDGTIRLGKSGKSYNVYDAKTGRWMRGAVKAAAPAASKPKATTVRGGTRKEAGLVNRPTNTNPTYGAEYVPGRGKAMLPPATKKAAGIERGRIREKPGGGGKQRWDGTKWVPHSRGRNY